MFPMPSRKTIMALLDSDFRQVDMNDYDKADNVQIAEFPSDMEIMLSVQEEFEKGVEEGDGEVDRNNEEEGN